MEKLIPLLNERHNLEWVLGSSRDNGDYLFVKGDKENKFYEEQIISKKFGFIQRLVENDKIDRLSFTECPIIYNGQGAGFYSDYEKIIMLLSISDTPIDDLISMLE